MTLLQWLGLGSLLVIIALETYLIVKSKKEMYESKRNVEIIYAHSIYQKIYSSMISNTSSKDDLDKWEYCFDIFTNHLGKSEVGGFSKEKLDGMKNGFISDYKVYLSKHYPEHELIIKN